MTLATIVIPVWNRLDLTRQCLESLRRHPAHTPHEVIVVDNGSVDGTPELLHAESGWVRCIRNATNLGFAIACNQGAAQARGKYVAFLNNDTVARDGWLDALVELAEQEPGIAIAGSRLLFPDGAIQHAGVAMNRLFRSPYHLYQGGPSDAPYVTRRRELQMVTGACMLVRTSTFREVGGFDEGYLNGFEDADLCLRVRAAGGRVVYEPASTLIHFESRTPGRHAHDDRNLIRFQSRWGGPRWVDEDLIHFEDGFCCYSVVHQGRITSMRAPIRSANEHARFGEAARVQAHLHRPGYAPVEQVIREPETWPSEASTLEWASRLCLELGLDAMSAGFRARGETAYGIEAGTGLPLATYSQVLSLRPQLTRAATTSRADNPQPRSSAEG